MDGDLRVGVVGCGYWGPNLIRNFRSLPGVRVTAACDVDPARLDAVRRMAPDVDLDADYRALLRRPDVDAVAVATPVGMHSGMALAALAAGKHVYVEKPLATDVPTALAMVRAARVRKRTLMVGHTYLFAQPILELKRRVDLGELGKILYVHSTRVNLGLFRRDVNVLWDLAPHDLSIVGFVLGDRPESVCAQGSAHVTPGVEDVAFLLARYPGGVEAHAHVSWLDPCKVRRITWVGDRKMAVCDDLASDQPLQIYDRGVERWPYYETYGEFKMMYRAGDVVAPHVAASEPLRDLCAEFVDCVRTGREPARGSGTEAIDVVCVLAAAQRSLADGGVRVPVVYQAP